MKIFHFMFLQFLLVTAGASAQEPIEIRGNLAGCDGTPLKNAYVSLLGHDTRFRHYTDSNGLFSFSVDEAGGYWLWLTGIHHKTLLIPLLLNESLEFDVHLAAASYVSEFDSVFVIGDFNDYSYEDGAIMMHKQPDGTLSAAIAIQADTLGYQLLGVQKNGLPLSGTQADRYVFDSKRPLIGGKSGKYISVIEADSGRTQIVFNPKELPHSESEAAVVFRDPNSIPSRIVDVHAELEGYKRRFMEAFEAHRKAGKDPNEFHYDWSDVKTAIVHQMDSQQPPVVRQYLLLNYFHFGSDEADSLMARRVFREVPPTSALWSLELGSPLNLLSAIAQIANQPDFVRSYAERVSEEHSDSTVREAFLFYALNQARAAGDANRVGRYYTRLMDEFAGTQYAQMAKAWHGPDRKIMGGKPVPEFAFTSLDDSTATVTPGRLRGRIYLIDFWATWCGPCVSEMEYLQDAYKKYKDRGFTILSISFDRKPEDVSKFRQKKWPMPWFNAFVAGGFTSDTAKAFEVMGIPKPILVGKDGTIIASGVELRREKLETTLKKTFETADKN